MPECFGKTTFARSVEFTIRIAFLIEAVITVFHLEHTVGVFFHRPVQLVVFQGDDLALRVFLPDKVRVEIVIIFPFSHVRIAEAQGPPQHVQLGLDLVVFPVQDAASVPGAGRGCGRIQIVRVLIIPLVHVQPTFSAVRPAYRFAPQLVEKRYLATVVLRFRIGAVGIIGFYYTSQSVEFDGGARLIAIRSGIG